MEAVHRHELIAPWTNLVSVSIDSMCPLIGFLIDKFVMEPASGLISRGFVLFQPCSLFLLPGCPIQPVPVSLLTVSIFHNQSSIPILCVYSKKVFLHPSENRQAISSMANKPSPLFVLNVGYLVNSSYAQTEQPSWSGTPRSGIGRRQHTRLANTIIENTTATLNQRSEDDGGDAAANTQMVTTILSSVVGTIFLVVLGILLWHFYNKHQSKRHAMTRLETPDKNEFEKWRMSSMPATLRVDKHPIPSSPLATPIAAQSHASKRYYSQPNSPHVFDRDRGGPRSGSAHGLLDCHTSIDSRPTSQNGLSDHAGHRYSRSASNVRGYMQHRAERSRSTQSLTTRRAPTPLFGDGITPDGDENDIPHIPEPVRPRLTPLPPLAGSPSMSGDDFDFGFQQRRMTMERNKRYFNASELSFNELPAAPTQHF